jgi:hypothetical protein
MSSGNFLITKNRGAEGSGSAWTTMGGGRTVMYDRRQIEQILNANSTYAITGEKQLTL